MREATKARAVLRVLLPRVDHVCDLTSAEAVRSVGCGLQPQRSSARGDSGGAAAAPFVQRRAVSHKFRKFTGERFQKSLPRELAQATGLIKTQTDNARAGFPALTQCSRPPVLAASRCCPPRCCLRFGANLLWHGHHRCRQQRRLTTDMSVTRTATVVGKIVAVGPTTATVQLVTDDDSVVGARLVKTGDARGIAGNRSAGRKHLAPTGPDVAGQRRGPARHLRIA